MATPDVATSLRMPVEWLSRADILAGQLCAIPEFAAILHGNPSRSAALRLAIFRGLVGLEALASPDGYGPWIEMDGVHARYNAAGLWFVRIGPAADGFEIASNRGGLVHREGREATIDTARGLGDRVVARLSADGIVPAVLAPRLPVTPRVDGRDVKVRLPEMAAKIHDEIDDASDYIVGLLLRHEAEWKGAWDDLRRAGWTRAEVGVAVARMHEHSLVNDMRSWRFHEAVPEVLAWADKEAASVNISPTRWAELVEATRQEHVANQLLVLSREVILGNTRARTRINSTTRLAWGRRGAEGEVVQVTVDSDEPAKDEARRRAEALGDNDPVFIDHGPYMLRDDTLQVSLALKVPDTDRERIALMVKATLGLPSARWHL